MEYLEAIKMLVDLQTELIFRQKQVTISMEPKLNYISFSVWGSYNEFEAKNRYHSYGDYEKMITEIKKDYHKILAL